MLPNGEVVPIPAAERWAAEADAADAAAAAARAAGEHTGLRERLEELRVSAACIQITAAVCCKEAVLGIIGCPCLIDTPSCCCLPSRMCWLLQQARHWCVAQAWQCERLASWQPVRQGWL